MTTIPLTHITALVIIAPTMDIITIIITLTEDIIKDREVQCQHIPGILQAMQELLPGKPVLQMHMIQGTEPAQPEMNVVLV